MPTPRKNVLNLKANFKDKYIAFIDVMGFSNLVNKGSVDNLESYFSRITEVLDQIKVDKAQIESFLISDSIILIAPDTQKDLVQLLTAIRRIQSALLWKKILMRGAVSFGQVYYNPKRNIIVGKGFIRAYLLESEAVYPRVIIDPSIVKKISTDKTGFIHKINGSEAYTFENRIIYTHRDFTGISDDAIFIDYANKSVKKERIVGSLRLVYESIVENLYGEQKLYSKYIWLKDYFLACLTLTTHYLEEDSQASQRHKDKIEEWTEKFRRL